MVGNTSNIIDELIKPFEIVKHEAQLCQYSCVFLYDSVVEEKGHIWKQHILKCAIPSYYSKPSSNIPVKCEFFFLTVQVNVELVLVKQIIQFQERG